MINMIKGITNLFFNPTQASANIPKEVQDHLDRAQHLLQLEGILELEGGVSLFYEKIEGLEVEKVYFQDALQKADLNENVKLVISEMHEKIKYTIGSMLVLQDKFGGFIEDIDDL